MINSVEDITNPVHHKVAGSTSWVATVVTSLEELESYAGEWNELLVSSEANSIFLTWEWLSAWCQTVYPDVKPFVVAIRDGDGRLVALAPFYLSDLRLLGLVRYKCLRAIGDCHCGAEYADVIIRRGYESRAMSCVMSELLDHAEVWDCIWLSSVAGWTGARERFGNAAREAGLYVHEREHHFGVLPLPDTYGAYLQQLSRNRREQVRRKARQLKKAHDVTFVRCSRQDEVSGLLSHLFTLHRIRWESVGQAGSFVRRPSMKLFYEAFAPVALDQGRLRLYAMKVDGVVRAVQYGYAYEGVFSQVQEGFEIEGFDGIGNILRYSVVEASIEEGLREYDFLGGFTDHKARFGAKPRTGYDMFIGRRSFKNRVLFSEEIWPTGRFIREGRPANEGYSHN